MHRCKRNSWIALRRFIYVWCVVVYLLNVVTARRDSSAKEIQNVTTIVEHKASLPCDLSPPTQEDEVYLVLWYKDDSAIPIYSIDARNPNGLGVSLATAKHVTSDSLTGRSYFHTVPRPATLLLETVTTQDAGVYRCRVDFRVAKTRNSLVRLQVIVPPREPIIKNQFGVIAQGLVGPYTQGQRLLLVCDTKGGFPTPSVTWWSGTELLDDSYELTPEGISRNQLQIQALDREHAGMKLVCQASNNLLSPPVSVAVTLNVYLSPKTVHLVSPPAWVTADVPVQFVCRTTGSLPAANITWWLESSRLPILQQESFEEENTTTSVLTLIPSVKDNQKELACAAANSLIPMGSIEDVIKLQVHYPPQVEIRLGMNLRYATFHEGHDVYMECHVMANPWITEVAFLFEGHEITTNTTAGIIVTNQTLVLQRLRRESRGRYTCTALNELGRSESNPLYLRVQYAPLCKENQKMFYGVSKLKKTKVVCQVEADPTEVSFRWTFNNSREDIDVISYENDGLRSVASYTPRTDLDYGTLMCWGINKVGMQREPCLFYVVPAGVPDSPANCTVANQTGYSFSVQCQPGDGNGLMQIYHLQVRDDEYMTTVSNLSSDYPQFLVKDLPTGRTFTLVIYSVNDLGSSSPVVVSGVTLATSDRLTTNNVRGGDNNWQQKLSSTVVILICLSVGFVIVAALAVVAFKIKRGKLKGSPTAALKAPIRSSEVNGGVGEMMDMATILDSHNFKSGLIGPKADPKLTRELQEWQQNKKRHKTMVIRAGSLSPLPQGEDDEPEGDEVKSDYQTPLMGGDHHQDDSGDQGETQDGSPTPPSPGTEFAEQDQKDKEDISTKAVTSTPDLLLSNSAQLANQIPPPPPQRRISQSKQPKQQIENQGHTQGRPTKQKRQPPRPPPRPPRRRTDSTASSEGVASNVSGSGGGGAGASGGRSSGGSSPVSENTDFRQTVL